jgi:low affinity Fe/Cu permease
MLRRVSREVSKMLRRLSRRVSKMQGKGIGFAGMRKRMYLCGVIGAICMASATGKRGMAN